MTPANKRRLSEVATGLVLLVEENPPSQICLLHILRVFMRLSEIATDFHIRPEANDLGAHRGGPHV